MNGEGAVLLQAVAREPAVTHVHRELRRAILQGQMAFGSRLVETSLARRLNVSRTPVREAIQRLETEGLVRRLRHGGVVVEDVRSRNLDTVLIRQALERASARIACARGSDDELTRLQVQTRGDIEAMPGLSSEQRGVMDRAFHLRLARATHSMRLCKLVEEYYENCWTEVVLDLPKLDEQRSIQLHAQHIDIAAAVARRDPDAAEQAIIHHIDAVHRFVTAHLGTAQAVVADEAMRGRHG